MMNIHFTNPDIARRFSYLEIDESVIEDAKYGWLIIRNELNAILEKFLHKMDVLGFADQIADAHELKLKLYRHWANLFSCSFSNDYIEQVRRSGIAHREVGLEPAHLTIGYAFIIDEMIKVLEKKITDDPARRVRTIRAINKLGALDAGIALSSYNAVLLD
ncbi:MAG: hypothetical protein C0605_07550 [Hyphomicrobiales bacterium]|nr:MAG: hypothetical protein C0605_07550 [Hyphomicrobiales bacterium]